MSAAPDPARQLWRVLRDPVVTLGEAARQGYGLGAFAAWLACEALLVHPVSVAGQLLRLGQSPAAALIGLWSTYVSYALGPAIGVLAAALLVASLRRLLGRPRVDVMSLAGALGLAYAPHLLLVALGAALSARGLELAFLPHHLGRLPPGLELVRALLAYAPPALLAYLALLRRPELGQGEVPRSPKLAMALAAIVLLGLAGSLERMIVDYDVARPPLRGDRLPSFTARGLGGPDLRSDELRGTVALLDFWATWCTPCVASMPVLERLHRDLGPRGLRLVSLNVEPADEPAVPAFIARHHLSFPVYRDEGAARQALKVQSYPTAVLVDADGIIDEVYVGVTPYERLHADIEALLGAAR